MRRCLNNSEGRQSCDPQVNLMSSIDMQNIKIEIESVPTSHHAALNTRTSRARVSDG